MRLRFHDSIHDLEPKEWRALQPSDYPFLDHAFLAALEDSGCVGEGTGWEPRFVTAWNGDGLAGAVPLYEKADSFGEFVFDWDWAAAYARLGHDYYPKMVAAVPFTPAAAPKFLVAPGADRPAVVEALAAGVRQREADLGASSTHFLFVTEEDAEALATRGYLLRAGYQYHWQNRGYRDFDGFLSEMTGKRRREAKRERRQVREAGLEVSVRQGADLGPGDAETVYSFYLSTHHKNGGIPYLNADFFARVFASMRDSIVLVEAHDRARHAGRPVAAALNFRRGTHIFGRYWGCLEEYRSLHFELCYYQEIEFAIREGLAVFEAGAQGEHKFQRGLLPRPTWSAHRIANPRFRRAIADYLRRERALIEADIAAHGAHSPFREELNAP